MSKEFRFQVDPTEDLVGRETRWDKELAELHDQGLTVQGVGPDGDYPVRYDFDESGTTTFDEWWKGNPETPWFEVYNLVQLRPLEDFTEPGDELLSPAVATLRQAMRRELAEGVVPRA